MAGLNKLSARTVATLSKSGRFADGGGLYLAITPSGGKSWTFRWMKDGRRREAGLGSVTSVGLADARRAAQECREIVGKGGDPIAARGAVPRAMQTFGDVALGLIEGKASECRSAKHVKAYRATLETYAKSLWGVPVDKIDTAAVLAVLTPIWQAKPETGSRVRQRIEAVLDAATARGHRSGMNPAAWKGHLAHVLPKRAKLSRGHYKALPYQELPGFMARLRELDSPAASALEFLILTAARTGEVLGATWGEIEGNVWRIPAGRMKAAKEHRVPLCDRALAIVDEMRALRINDFVFPGKRARMHGMALSEALARLKVEGTTHGMRSTFRDWCGNETNFPREVCEAALAHVLGGVEGAYRRSDALDKRRALMTAWAQYCEPLQASNVLKLERR